MADKKAIILRHNGGELGNQLWNAMSIYAFTLEKKYNLSNWTQFEYAHLFRIKEEIPFAIKTLFFAPYRIAPKLTKKLYKVSAKMMISFLGNKVLHSGNSPFIEGPFYLPPTKDVTIRDGNIFFDGWMFRNPAGLMKYREQILKRFAFKEEVEKRPRELIAGLRKKFKTIIGVHIRMGDYRTFKNGKYFVEPARFSQIVEEYKKERNVSQNETAILICSNEKVDISIFQGTSIQTNFSGPEDLYALSLCDVVIGSDSSFGALAAYKGNIPHIVATHDTVDWAYYREQKNFFFGKYSTVIGY
jgi:hypothetical protein